MNKISSIILVSVAVSLGAVAVACGDYSASPSDAGSAGLSDTGGSAGSSGTGGAVAGTGGAVAGTGGVVAGTGGIVAGTGGVVAGTGGVVAGTGGEIAGTGGEIAGSGGTGGTPSITLPGEVLQNAGLPCVSAHSTVRVIISGYSGPLYQVCKGLSFPGPNSCRGTTQDIGTVEGGYADAASQDAFCTGGGCTISKIYDQSGQGNDLEPAPPGGAKPTPDDPANAADLPVTINGHSAYGILIKPGMGYRTGCNTCTIKKGNGTAVGDEPQTMYMVTSQHDLVDGCCFDYGNAETTCNDDGNGTMETIYFGAGVVWGTGSGNATGPWVMADLENGLYAGWDSVRKSDQNISTNKPLLYDFVTAVVVGDTWDKNGGKGRFALYGGDATADTPLQTMYDGIRPEKSGYVPMQKQGSIILGTGGDNSAGDGGRYYEGIMANGVATKETLDALQAAIAAAKYGQ
jgi:hypothetical protein